MKFYTSYYSKCKVGDNRLAISQGVPAWYTGRRSKILAPDWKLVMDLKNNNISEEAFTEKYVAQLESIGILAVENVLHDGDVLLCWEASNKFCHRHILAEWLREHGHTVSELQ